MRLILGVTASVAATLTSALVAALKEAGHEVQIIATDKSFAFWDTKSVEVRVWRDGDEWAEISYERGQPIAHIDLRNWADAIVIAPLTANTLAKIANGLADNLLTSIIRAWDRSKPIIIAPAMNTQMWAHPATEEHLATLRRWYPKLTVVMPVEKTLACGERGIGAMAAIETIVATLPQPPPLKGGGK